MPTFWQFPTVSMGLGPICSIYHARFLRYMEHRGLLDTSKSRVWAYLGDGECDEPESLGALTLASRENLDNLTWVINCNLQRLDGPVRGNGKIIQELEAAFRGAGWNVIKVVWGTDWDPLLDADEDGKLVKRMGEVVDGQYQKYTVSSGEYTRQHFFGTDPDILKLVEHLSDETIASIRRGGHDPEKVYAAYHAAVNHKGAPTVILAKTVKGYGLGEAGEGQNVAHNQKKIAEDALKAFRTRFNIPVSDAEIDKLPFYRPDADSPEMEYLHERRKALGGFIPERPACSERLEVPGTGRQDFHRETIIGRQRRRRRINNIGAWVPSFAEWFGTKPWGSASCQLFRMKLARSAWKVYSRCAAFIPARASCTNRSIRRTRCTTRKLETVSCWKKASMKLVP